MQNRLPSTEPAENDGEDGQIVHFPAGEIGEIRRNRYLLAAAASPLLLSFAALIASIAGNPRYAGFMAHPAMLAAVLVSMAWTRNPRPKTLWPKVEASRSGIRIGEHFIPRARIKEGFFAPRPGERGLVRLGLAGTSPNVELSVSGEETARRLLRALGLDTTQTVARFRLMSQLYAGGKMRWWIAGLVASCMLLMRIAQFFDPRAFVAFPFIILALGVLFLLPARLDVGVDGLVVTWLGRARFIPMRDIQSVFTSTRGLGRSKVRTIVITLTSGETVELPATQRGWDDRRAELVAERINEAKAAAEGGPGAADDAARLARGSRPMAEWVADLRAIGTGANATHRIAPVPHERLWRVVEDPSSLASARAAAAVALAPALDDDGRLRMKRVAQAVAAPRLRVALEATATSDAASEEASRALETLAEEEAEAAGGS